MRPMSSRARAARPARVRALRIARAVASAPLCGVRRETARVRGGPRGDRVRRPGAGARPCVEGARATSPRPRSGRARRRGRRAAGRGLSRPCPGDPERALQRGRVAPHALSVELGRVWHLPACHLLARSQALPRQRGLSLDERRRNVRGSVVLRAEDVPRSICLVDDVYTSGATADACAAAARRGGARRVSVVTLARAVR